MTLTRTVILGNWEVPPVRPEQFPVVPHAQAARAIGHPEAPSLLRLAREGLQVVDPVEAHLLLEEAARRLSWRDPSGAALAFYPSLQELMRAGVPPFVLRPLKLRLAQFLETYLALLDERGSLDEAQVFGRASPRPRPILLWGYPLLPPSELEFLERLAAQGSEVYLPWGKEPAFTRTQAIAHWFQQRGWQVIQGPAWSPPKPVEVLSFS